MPVPSVTPSAAPMPLLSDADLDRAAAVLGVTPDRDGSLTRLALSDTASGRRLAVEVTSTGDDVARQGLRHRGAPRASRLRRSGDVRGARRGHLLRSRRRTRGRSRRRARGRMLALRQRLRTPPLRRLPDRRAGGGAGGRACCR